MAGIMSGGCACGAIRYECGGEPVLMVNCHCRDCQRANGSAYAAFVIVRKAGVRISGEPRYHTVRGNAGRAVDRGFCASCGSQVVARLEKFPDLLGFQAGSLDDPSIYRPAVEVFTASAQPWDYMNPETKKHPEGMG
jgi:hypothetical protein